MSLDSNGSAVALNMRLKTNAFVAQHLVKIMNNQTTGGELSFIDWEIKANVW